MKKINQRTTNNEQRTTRASARSSSLLITHDSLFIENRRRGFTLIELLVVISIIAILIAILVPAAITAEQRAYVNATMGDMRTISTGLQAYHADFNMYPQSTLPSGATYYYTSPGNAIKAGQAYSYLAECLLGYLPGNYDGAPRNSSNPGYLGGTLSQTKGFRVGVSNTVYGPYLDIGANNIGEMTGAAPTQFYFGDSFPPAVGGQPTPILYFSANSSPSTTDIFNATAGYGIFDSTDDSAAPGVPAPTGPQTAGSPTAQFLSIIGGNASNTVPTGTVLSGAKNYLLVSAGLDGNFFTGDDLVYGQ